MPFACSFTPNFSKGNGLLPTIVQCTETGEVLMLAYMNEESFRLTLASGEAHYWSRSRNSLWHKGESSGHTQQVISIRLDCDDDTLLLFVRQIGNAACHTGRRSCFYKEWKNKTTSFCSPLVFDPVEVYKK